MISLTHYLQYIKDEETCLSVCKTPKGLMRGIMAAKKVKKFPGFVICLNFKDSAFTTVKRHATPGKLGM